MKISQREAHRLKSENRNLQREIRRLKGAINAWREYDYVPDATEIFAEEVTGGSLVWAIKTAAKLNHSVVVRYTGTKLSYRALPQPEGEKQ